MKKIKENYFRVIITLLFVGVALVSCAPTQKLTTNVIYDNYSTAGIDARGLTVIDNYVITGGAGGGISFLDLNDDNRAGNMIIEDIEDFRDVFCVSSSHCHFMNSGKSGKVLRMAETGSTGVTLDTTGVFLNGIDFWNDSTGIVMGDPVANHFFIAITKDYGNNWQAMDTKTILPPRNSR